MCCFHNSIRNLFVITILLASCTVRKEEVINLKCESFINPVAIGTAKPRLSWNITTGRRNWMQATYQLLVASDSIKLSNNEGDLWDTGSGNYVFTVPL